MAGALPIVVSAKPVTARPNVGTTEPRAVRWALTLLAVGFLTLFIVIPAANVFAQALSKGVGAYIAVLKPAAVDADAVKKLPILERVKAKREQAVAAQTWRSIKMTLGVAAIVVPLNVVFGVAAAWAIAKFRFKGRAVLVTLIDLPFSVSPVVAGLLFVLLFGRMGWFGKW